MRNGEARKSGKHMTVRRHLRMFEKMIKSGAQLAETDLEELIAFTRRIMEQPNANVRDRLRASETLFTLMKEAAKLDMEREKLDHGGDDAVTINVHLVEPEDRH